MRLGDSGRSTVEPPIIGPINPPGCIIACMSCDHAIRLSIARIVIPEWMILFSNKAHVGGTCR
jgi:hypothetical protein